MARIAAETLRQRLVWTVLLSVVYAAPVPAFAAASPDARSAAWEASAPDDLFSPTPAADQCAAATATEDPNDPTTLASLAQPFSLPNPLIAVIGLVTLALGTCIGALAQWRTCSASPSKMPRRSAASTASRTL
jgi:hypothetical protein